LKSIETTLVLFSKFGSCFGLFVTLGTEKKLDRSFNFTFHYIDDVFSLNNSMFGDFVDRIYPNELEIKDTTDTDRYASSLDLHLQFDSESGF
jgi:hypothetical protein